MKPIKTTYRLHEPIEKWARRAGIEFDMPFVPQIGMLLDAGNGELREVLDVAYFVKTHSAHVWLESYPYDRKRRLQRGGWKEGYLP